MGNCEETTACKPEKPSSPPPPPVTEHQQTSVHAYPDWAAMQAYYGHSMAVPPYFNSGHPPPAYMWAPPQVMHMMPPYAAMYPHYPHPAGVPLASPMSIDSPAKSSGNSERGLMKKLKGFDGLAMSIGNGISHSGDTEASSQGSDGNTDTRKRSREVSPAAEAGKISGHFFHKEPNGVTALTVVTSDSEIKKSPTAVTMMTSATAAMMPNQAQQQNERELKRERRKQSNRESARRSRLRKQAEAEELAIKVDALTSENLTLKSEINRLTDNSQKLKLQNAKLTEKLKNVQEENDTEDKSVSLSTANLLSRVDSCTSEEGGSGNDDEEEMVYTSSSNNNNNQNSNATAKLRQLLDASPRADAVAAG
ncbi:common plant regulatory factor 1 isoform X1 [Lactuca sativa]|uniref:BZIP domain-containing protein n=1 Tax=Lactuca sativa TaxID=4236 RepID=A0A9R1X4A9_LACSA|nr:common plant regulatory factor 1 isoform X1 [Lactuca sativa]KAJ0197994.1 hypothetical protein LSAT_V11C700343220 [Lactuca sativa]